MTASSACSSSMRMATAASRRADLLTGDAESTAMEGVTSRVGDIDFLKLPITAARAA